MTRNINMKTITKTIEAYDINELKELYPEGYEKAYSNFKDGNEYFFLEEDMSERLKELLEENNIKYRKYPDNVGLPEVLYSLSHCQGDGACFTGDFIYKGYNINVKHSGHYYHYNSKNITITDDEGNDIDGQVMEDFDALYIEICKELEQFGYSFIEYGNSEECFIENCEANEHYFNKEGEIVE